jgi:hypothetical protein
MYSLDVSAVGLEGIRLRSQLHELHLLPLSSPSSPAGLSLSICTLFLSQSRVPMHSVTKKAAASSQAVPLPASK